MAKPGTAGSSAANDGGGSAANGGVSVTNGGGSAANGGGSAANGGGSAANGGGATEGPAPAARITCSVSSFPLPRVTGSRSHLKGTPIFGLFM